jgi:hypothetical protein
MLNFLYLQVLAGSHFINKRCLSDDRRSLQMEIRLRTDREAQFYKESDLYTLSKTVLSKLLAVEQIENLR